MIYETFARVYDRLMDDQLYDEWFDYVKERIPLITNGHPTKLLELACGSGTLALKLKKAGYDVTGLDFSEEMLALADEKFRAAGVDVPLINGDMRDLTDLPMYDAVTCFDDSICYMANRDEVQDVFKTVREHLVSEGRFLFDAHSIFQIDEFFPGYMYNNQTETTAFMWTSYEGEVPHSIEHDLTFFIYDEQIDAYQVLSETHHERTYPIEEWISFLAEVGFSNVLTSANFGKEAIQPDSIRWFFEAQND